MKASCPICQNNKENNITCEQMIDQYIKGNYQEAYNLALLLSKKGHGCAYNLLGNLYYLGENVKRDLSKAIKYYKKACEKNWPGAFYNLGWYYYNGIEVNLDKNISFHLYKKAAELGNHYAQFKLGILYFHGIGTSRDADLALQFVQKASTQGHQEAIDFMVALSVAADPKVDFLDTNEILWGNMANSSLILDKIIKLIFYTHSINSKITKTTDVRVFSSISFYDLEEILNIKLNIINQWKPFLHSNYKNETNHNYIAIDIAALLHLINSLIIYLNCEAPPDERNMPMLYELLSAGIPDSDDSIYSKSNLDRLFDMLEEKNASHPALRHYKWYKLLSDDKYEDVIKLCQQSLAPLGPENDFLKFVNNCEDIKSLVSLLDENILNKSMSEEAKLLLIYSISYIFSDKKGAVTASMVKETAINLDYYIKTLDSQNELKSDYFHFVEKYYQVLKKERHRINKEISDLFWFYEEYSNYKN